MTGKKYTVEQLQIAFWSKTRPDGDCLIWTGNRSKHTPAQGGPRPLVKIHGHLRYAHQVALEWKLGRRVIRPLQTNHTCDRPLCVEWDHLYEGTQAQNVEDRIARGRSRHPRGEEHGAAKLTDAQVREIKVALKAGDSQVSLSILYEVSNQLISRIAAGTIWRHVVV